MEDDIDQQQFARKLARVKAIINKPKFPTMAPEVLTLYTLAEMKAEKTRLDSCYRDLHQMQHNLVAQGESCDHVNEALQEIRATTEGLQLSIANARQKIENSYSETEKTVEELRQHVSQTFAEQTAKLAEHGQSINTVHSLTQRLIKVESSLDRNEQRYENLSFTQQESVTQLATLTHDLAEHKTELAKMGADIPGKREIIQVLMEDIDHVKEFQERLKLNSQSSGDSFIGEPEVPGSSAPQEDLPAIIGNDEQQPPKNLADLQKPEASSAENPGVLQPSASQPNPPVDTGSNDQQAPIKIPLPEAEKVAQRFFSFKRKYRRENPADEPGFIRYFLGSIDPRGAWFIQRKLWDFNPELVHLRHAERKSTVSEVVYYISMSKLKWNHLVKAMHTIDGAELEHALTNPTPQAKKPMEAIAEERKAAEEERMAEEKRAAEEKRVAEENRAAEEEAAPIAQRTRAAKRQKH
ncbi:hypothetical protein F4778DRAFT_776094 [Xylariomycetidae sp. FL2044]|nr:hypothetical protein F4778DRAFT_776094 [Xylariomycetidae sp. FL2044]